MKNDLKHLQCAQLADYFLDPKLHAFFSSKTLDELNLQFSDMYAYYESTQCPSDYPISLLTLAAIQPNALHFNFILNKRCHYAGAYFFLDALVHAIFENNEERIQLLMSQPPLKKALHCEKNKILKAALLCENTKLVGALLKNKRITNSLRKDSAETFEICQTTILSQNVQHLSLLSEILQKDLQGIKPIHQKNPIDVLRTFKEQIALLERRLLTEQSEFSLDEKEIIENLSHRLKLNLNFLVLDPLSKDNQRNFQILATQLLENAQRALSPHRSWIEGIIEDLKQLLNQLAPYMTLGFRHSFFSLKPTIHLTEFIQPLQFSPHE